MTTYNKDQKYVLKVITTDNQKKEVEVTPEKDMSKPEMIMYLKSKYKNFFKLIESKNDDKYIAVVTTMNKYNNGQQGYLGKDNIVATRKDALKFNSRDEAQKAVKQFKPKYDYTIVKTNIEKEGLTESKLVKSYNETDYGYHNNVTNLYGELADGNWYVFNTEVGNAEIYDSPITDKFIDAMYNYKTDDELADDTWYDNFQKEHNVTNKYDRDKLNIIDNELRTRYYGQSDMLEEDNKKLSGLIDFASTKMKFTGFTKEIFKYIEKGLIKEFGKEWYKKSYIDLEEVTWDLVEYYCTHIIDDDSIDPNEFYKVVFDYINSIDNTKVENMKKFNNIVTDKKGNELILSGASYNKACYWLEKELSKNGNKILNTTTDTVNPSITVIRTDSNIDYVYNEEDGTLKILNESKLEESPKMKFELLPDSLKNQVFNIAEMYEEDKLNSDDDVFDGTEDSYADEMLQQHIYDLFDNKDMKVYMSEHYDTTTQASANTAANLVANKIYNAIIEDDVDSLFGEDITDSDNDPNEFIVNVDALYDKYGENKLPSGCTIQLSLGNKYLFSEEFHNGQEPVCCNGEHCRLMWVYNGVCGIKNLHFNDCSFELTEDEFLALSSFTVPLDESKNIDDKVKSIVDSISKDIKKGEKKEYNYSNSLKFVIYRDKEYDDIYQVYTYIDNNELDYLDTNDIHIDDMYGKLMEIVKEVHKELKETVNMIVEDKGNNGVIVINYGKGVRFPDRETAIKFFKECVVGTDPNSSEHYRYLTILWELENSKNTIVYDSDDEEEYNWWVSKGKPIEDISQELLDAHKLD